MPEETPETLAQILADEGLEPAQLREILDPIHPVDLAEGVGDLPPDDQARVLEALDPPRAAAVLEAIPSEMRAAIIDRAGETRLMGVIDAMSPQAVAEIIDHLPAHKERAMISKLDEGQREEIEDHLQYAPKTAGAKMTRNYVEVPENFTAGRALRAIQGAVNTETVSNLYVVDDNGHIVGVCGLGSLMTHSPETPLSEFMRREVHFVGVTVDQEEVARMARKYRLKAVPVVDNQMRLLGVVTLRDLIEVVHEEANEDVLHVAGAASVHPVHSGVLTRVRGRLPWLGVAMAFQLALSWVMMGFHDTLSIVALTFFIPVIMAMGGNVGLQSSTTVVRGIATGDIAAGRMMRVVAMESRAGVLIAVLCGVVTGLTAWLMHLSQPTAVRLSVIVTVSMIASIAFAGVIGSAIPFILHRMKRDPAVASGPFITSLLDIVNVTIYLTLASVLLARTVHAA
ncbi:MAG TPA: magnesium transporter [Planctomycetota bacterium]|nr:magnesium transporter [Planctomycetota bacterium]